MNFSEALEELKEGKKLQREGWNGKGMFIYWVPGGEYKAQTAAARDTFGDLVPYRGYIAIKTAQNDVVPWVASQSDILEEDWQIVK